MIFIIGVGLVISANPISKVNPGHDSTEIMVNIEGNDKTLQQAIDAGDLAGGGDDPDTEELDILVTEVSICFNGNDGYGTQLDCPDGYKMFSCSGSWGKTDHWDDVISASSYSNGCQWIIMNPDCNSGHFKSPPEDFIISYTCMKYVGVGLGKYGHRRCELDDLNYPYDDLRCGEIEYF